MKKKKLIIAAALALLLSGCFIPLPFFGDGGEDLARLEASNEPQSETQDDVPPDEAFPFEVFEPAQSDSGVPTPPKQTQESAINFEPTPAARTRLWPRDQNIPLVIENISKTDLAGRRARYDVELQWRQSCETQDSDWYGMNMKHGPQTPDDYVLVQSTGPDTVFVLASVMREIDPTGSCEFSFRARMRAGRRFSTWYEMPERFRLVDPLTLQIISEPRLRTVE